MKEKIDKDFAPLGPETAIERYRRVLKKALERLSLAIASGTDEEVKQAGMKLAESALELQGGDGNPVEAKIEATVARLNDALQSGDRAELRAVLSDIGLPEIEDKFKEDIWRELSNDDSEGE